ncbi:FliM/FliN family flagellar motor switch protein, partial [Escherichia sp. SS-MK2]
SISYRFIIFLPRTNSIFTGNSSKLLISLLPESEKNIEIRVNGALTGYGELVEVDDKLGVEIHSWLSGNNNVK